LGLPKERLGRGTSVNKLPLIKCLPAESQETQLSKRIEKIVVLSLLAGFLLFLVLCSCKNENLVDPLDILDKNHPEMWTICADCGLLSAAGRTVLAPPPEGGVSICTGTNPTSGPICFQYVLGSDMDVALSIYSEKGEKVATIVRERQSTGGHVQEWNLQYDSGVAVPNGTYRAYFLAGGSVTNGDIIVLR